MFVRLTMLVAALVVLPASVARAQFNGHNSLGDFGVLSASQPAPGFYASGFYYRYHTDTIRDRNGMVVDPAIPDERSEITLHALAPIAWYVSEHKILGANYGAMAVVPIANTALAGPIFGLEQETGVGLADLYVQPVNLGWHRERADFTAGLGIFAPTGRYEVDADDNTGLGMWSFELYGGGTFFFDAAKSWHLATIAFYETHTKKRDSGVKVGDILTLEGGFGKSFREGALVVGAAYYAQWKLSSDDLGSDPPPAVGRALGKHSVWGLGPEVTLPIATKNKFIASINVRYIWEFGARTKTEGQSLVVTATFPVPSIPLN